MNQNFYGLFTWLIPEINPILFGSRQDGPLWILIIVCLNFDTFNK